MPSTLKGFGVFLCMLCSCVLAGGGEGKVYGICMHKGGRVGGRILPDNRAIVLQQCGQCRWAGGIKRRSIRAQTTN